MKLTEAEGLALGELTAPEDMPEPESPTVAVEAYIQARKVVPVQDGRDAVSVAEFTVTTVDEDGTIHGSPFGPLAPADGWTFETIARPPLQLPTTRTTILATLTDGTTVELEGKNRVWMNSDGDLINPDLISTFQVI